MMQNTFTDQIDNILSNYYAEYERIFNVFDFSDNPDRFTEENQTVNFCRAVQSVFPDAVVWYEYPFNGNDYKNRFDAVIYIPACHSLLIVEAKCLRKDSKYRAMLNDLNRICISDNYTQIKLNGQIDTTYGIILADFWYKSGRHAYKKTLNGWCETTSVEYTEKEQPFIDFRTNASTYLENRRWDKKDFSAHRENYHLLSLIGKIK